MKNGEHVQKVKKIKKRRITEDQCIGFIVIVAMSMFLLTDIFSQTGGDLMIGHMCVLIIMTVSLLLLEKLKDINVVSSCREI